jgi:hypothetical protein
MAGGNAVDTAKALLRNRDLSLSSTATSVGFANRSAFGAAFRGGGCIAGDGGQAVSALAF